MIKSCLVIVVVFFGLHLHVHAQINESDTSRYQLQVGLTGFSQSGNVEFVAVRSRSEFLFQLPQKFVFKSQNVTLYQQFGSFTADEDLLSRNFLYWNPMSKVYPFAISFIQTNLRRKIDLRWFAGVGGTVKLIDIDKHKVKLSAGLVRESTHFLTDIFNQTAYSGSSFIHLWRATTYVSGWHQSSVFPFSFHYSAYCQPGFDSIPNNRLQADITAVVQVGKGLTITANYLIAYEQVTAQQIKQNDIIITFGLSYSIKG